MTKKKKILLAAGAVCLVVCLALVLVFAGRDSNEETPTGDMTYTVQVKNSAGAALENVGVYIYEDETRSELVWFDKTNAQGCMSFTDVTRDTYVAVLGDVPTGYAAEPWYPLTGELTEIVLSAGSMEDADLEELQYELGDMMLDFTITDTEGVEYTLSQLLQEKKAVVLNFWYIECAPCKMEFPYMQEAYEKYKGDIEILAMNPVNMDEEAIAAFKEELGLTFPMAMVDESWAQIMQLTAYPTTVVIDRYGNISLIHKGSIDSTDTFEQVFAYFTADDYVQQSIESIDEIVTKDEGSEDNPLQTGSTGTKIVVPAGEVYYLEFYKVSGMYMQVKGESSDFYVTYNGKNYEPSKSTVGTMVYSDGIYYPVKITICNTSDQEQTFYVSFSALKGTYGNPYSLTLGELSVKVSAGNDQGVYYTYTAPKDGTLTVKCLSASISKYDFTLYNLNSYALRNLGSDGNVGEDGYPTVSVAVKKGHKIQFIVSTLPDDSHNYPAGSFKFLVSLEDGTGEEAKKEELPKTVYTVTVTDDAGAPVSGVVVNVKGNFTYEAAEDESQTEAGTTDTEEETEEQTIINVDVNLTTDKNGVVTTEQVSGPYTATVRVPNGYKLNTTQYSLTAEEPSVTVKLQKIVMKDYTVQVTYPDGTPVSDAIVIVGSGVAFTDAKGCAVFNLEEDNYSAMILGIPEDYVLTEDSYAFSGGSTKLTVVLGYGPGHETNPIKLENQTSVETGTLAPGEAEYYEIHDVGGSTLQLEDEDAYVILNGEEIGPGPISVEIPEGDDPITLAVVNGGAGEESYTVNFLFPVGTRQNPKVFTNIIRFSAALEEGSADSYYLSWTPKQGGEVTISFRSSTDIYCDLILTCGDNTAKLLRSEDPEASSVTIRFEKNVPLILELIPIAQADGTYPGGDVDFSGTSLTYDSEEAGTTYTVTVRNESGEPQSGVQVQFLKAGAAVGDPVATDSNGVAEAVLVPGDYTVSFVDDTIVYDADAAVLTEAAPDITITISREDNPVADGMTRYSVTVTDFSDRLIPNVIVIFQQDGTAKGYSVVGSSGGTVTSDLPTGTYQVQLAFQGNQGYHYEETTAVVSAAAPSLKIQAALASTAAAEENWKLGVVTPVSVGGTYVTLQSDIVTYFSFKPAEQGVYRISTSDPKAVLSYWGDANYPADVTDELADYADNAFTISVNTTALGQNHVIGITGTSDSILIITRVGDAVEEVPYTVYEAKTSPEEEYPDVLSDTGEVLVKNTFTVSVGANEVLTKVDLTADTDDYQLVLNEADGYYHLGTKNGPIMYVQLTYNNENPDSPLEPSYIHLYKMVGGVDNTGTALRCIYKDANGNEVKEDYTACMLEYGANADQTYGIYPMTEDLKYMIQMGGDYMGWWDPDNTKGNLLFLNGETLDTSINLDIAWMFACCYFTDTSATMMALDLGEEFPVEEVPEEPVVSDDTAALVPDGELEEEAEQDENVPTEEQAPAASEEEQTAPETETEPEEEAVVPESETEPEETAPETQPEAAILPAAVASVPEDAAPEASADEPEA